MVFEMEGMTYLAIAYFGMLVAIGLWTWTVVQRSRRLDQRLLAMEAASAKTDEDAPSEA